MTAVVNVNEPKRDVILRHPQPRLLARAAQDQLSQKNPPSGKGKRPAEPADPPLGKGKGKRPAEPADPPKGKGKKGESQKGKTGDFEKGKSKKGSSKGSQVWTCHGQSV